MNENPVPPEFCSAPWKVLHVSPQGEVHTCYESTAPLGNVHENSLHEIWAGSRFVALRQKMLAGESVDACSKCRVKERAIEGRSLRTLLNERSGGDDVLRGLATANDPSPELAPEVLDLAFSNGCNLKCRMCSSTYSKPWIEDEMALYGRSHGQAREIGEEKLVTEIFPLLEKSVKRLILAGGEPLLDRKNKMVLRHLLSKGRTDVSLEYNTNGTLFDDETFELWKSFPKLQLDVSLDSSGARFEYLRKGARWSRIVENLAKVREKAPHAVVTCYSTITIFNVMTHPDFVKEAIETKLFSIADMNLHYLTYPSHFSVQVLSPEMKEKVRAKYFAFMKETLLLGHDFADSARMMMQMKMLLNYMNEKNESASIRDFVTATERLDGIRKESFRETFPELASL